MQHYKFIISICLLLFLQRFGFSQEISNFKQLQSGNDIPKEIYRSSTQKYKVLESKVKSQEKSRKEKKGSQKFHLESTFAIDQMMKNGYVLFNESTSNYVNKVANVLLANDPTLRKKLRFYTVKAETANAFATDRGSIFVTLGLLARLENEAQLAFILAHEIIHYQKKHNMNVFLEFENIEGNNSGFKKQETFNKLLKKSTYSKRIEEQADQKGIELFLKSAYGTETIVSVMDILGTSHSSSINTPFDIQYLAVENFNFPDSLKLEKVREIKAYEEDDKLSSHPSLDKRKEFLVEKLKDNSKTGNTFIVGETEFKKIQMLSEFEICNSLLYTRQYAHCLYQSYALNELFPEHPFPELMKVKALYGLAKSIHYESLANYQEFADSTQGEIQQIYHLVGNLTVADIHSLAAAHLWDYIQKYPEDKAMKLRLEDLMMDIYEKDQDELEEKDQDELEEKDPICSDIFSNLMKEKQFENFLTERPKEDEKELKKKANKGYQLGLKKVLIVNPSYQRINLRNEKQPIRFLEAESKQEEMVELIKKNAKKLKLNTKILDVNSMSKRTTGEDFNEIIELEKWVAQKATLPKGMVPDNHNVVLDLMTKYKVDHLAFMGGLGLKDRGQQSYIGYLIAASAYLTPIAVYHFLKPNNRALYFTLVFDVEKSKNIMISYNTMPYIDRKNVIDTNIYWMLLQMKQEEKQKK